MKKLILLSMVFFCIFSNKNANANVNVSLGGLNPPPTQFIAGAQDVSIMFFWMTRQGADSIVTSLTFKRLGAGTDDVGSVSIYNLGNYLATGYFSGGEVTFTGLHISLQTINGAIEVRSDINSNTSSSTLGVSLYKLTTLITPVQIANLNGNIHFISIAAMVFDGNVWPRGWQYYALQPYSQTVWGSKFFVSTVEIGIDTIKFKLSGTLPVSALSNPMLRINYNSYPGMIIGNEVIFVLTTNVTIFFPGGYDIYLNVDIASCSEGTLFVSIDSQKDVKYHTSIVWQQYAPSGPYPLMSNMEVMKCFSFRTLQENSGSNSHFARFILENVSFVPSDPNPKAEINLWDWNGMKIPIDSVQLYWNGNAYEGVAKFSHLEAEKGYNWNISVVIGGLNYNQYQTQQTGFWFQTKVCYLADAGTTKVDTVTTKSAIVSAKLQYPQPANGTEFYSSLYVLNEDKKNSFPTADTSIVFGTMWQTPRTVTDTVKGTYLIKNLDSCTNYSYWFEFRQPCGGVIKSEVGHFRTKGNCHTEDGKLFVFPNPAKSYITVRFNYGRDVDQKIGIYDLSGRLVYSGSVTNSQQKIDVSTLPTGMYIVKSERIINKYPEVISGKFIKVN